jgi:hypothetical protein
MPAEPQTTCTTTTRLALPSTPTTYMLALTPAPASPDHRMSRILSVLSRPRPRTSLSYSSSSMAPTDGVYLQGGGLGNSAKCLFVAKSIPPLASRYGSHISTIRNLQRSGSRLGAFEYSRMGRSSTTRDRLSSNLMLILGTLKLAEMLVLAGGATNANYDGFLIVPDDVGTILMKTQSRPVDCPTRGIVAMTSCQAEYGPQPNTTVVAFDPNSMETIKCPPP